MNLSEKQVCIIDYGSGNIESVYNIFRSIHSKVIITNQASCIEKATHLVLPGVGAFKTAVDKIRSLSSFDTLKSCVFVKKKLFLGICVGMQVLADGGDEHGYCSGLGWIPGTVRKINAPGLSLPHVGWNNLNIKRGSPILEGIGGDVDFYFVHSYCFETSQSESIVANAYYGTEFTAVINKDNIYGVQFHPEKSQRAGSRLLKNFLDLT